jgi:hypothetical protein
MEGRVMDGWGEQRRIEPTITGQKEAVAFPPIVPRFKGQGSEIACVLDEPFEKATHFVPRLGGTIGCWGQGCPFCPDPEWIAGPRIRLYAAGAIQQARPERTSRASNGKSAIGVIWIPVIVEFTPAMVEGPLNGVALRNVDVEFYRKSPTSYMKVRIGKRPYSVASPECWGDPRLLLNRMWRIGVPLVQRDGVIPFKKMG